MPNDMEAPTGVWLTYETNADLQDGLDGAWQLYHPARILELQAGWPERGHVAGGPLDWSPLHGVLWVTTDYEKAIMDPAGGPGGVICETVRRFELEGVSSMLPAAGDLDDVPRGQERARLLLGATIWGRTATLDRPLPLGCDVRGEPSELPPRWRDALAAKGIT